MKPTPRESIFLALLTIAFFVLAIMTYTSHGEDAFITFRYVRNFAHGHGLVFNAGERVEGYSNFLWLLLLTPAEWIGIRLHIAARLLSTAFLAALAIGGWCMARRIRGEQNSSIAAAWLALAFLFEPLLNYHEGRGLETVSYIALQGLALFAIAGGASVWIAGLIGGAIVLSRPEGIAFALALAPAVYFRATRDKQPAILAALAYAAIPIGCFILDTLARKFYYGEWVPNTMIAKRHGHDLKAGLWQPISYFLTRGGVPVIAAAIGILSALRSQRYRPLAVGALCLAIASTAFQISAGAIPNEGFRYLMPVVLPQVVGIWLLLAQYADSPPRSPWLLNIAGAVALAANMTLLFSTAQFHGRPVLIGDGNAPLSRLHSRLAQASSYNIGERLHYWQMDPVFINADAGNWVRENLPPTATLAGDQMGQFGFYAGENQTIIDLIGLMDRNVARYGPTVEYLRERHPDYIVVETCMDSEYWPHALRLQPDVAAIRELFAREEFRVLYRPRWFLVWRWSKAQLGFMVYIRNEIDDKKPLENIPVGVGDAEFERAWRVLGSE
ncbi:hypothetical protein BH09SUM1_BH09SUM1_17770 [soil metagenome]